MPRAPKAVKWVPHPFDDPHSRARCSTAGRSAPAADELQHDLAAIRPDAMFGKIKSLPSSDRKLARNDRNVERHAIDHGFDVRGHVVGSFGIVDPSGIEWRKPIKRGHQLGLHVGIGILLDDQGGGGVLEIGVQNPVPGFRFRQEARRIAGEAGARRFDAERRRGEIAASRSGSRIIGQSQGVRSAS